MENVKRQLFLFSVRVVSATIMLMLPIELSAQEIDFSTNAPRLNDEIQKQTVSYFSAGNDGKEVVWDFSSIRPTGDQIEMLYCYNIDSVFVCLAPEKMTKYILSEKRLSSIGYETPSWEVKYDDPVALMDYPFHYGEILSTDYKGHGSYCKTMLLDCYGSMYVEADAEGSIIFSEEDTLRNVIRTHQVRTNSIRIYSPEDTINTDVDTIKMKQDITETYLWYARGYRYPIYETDVTTYYDDLKPIATENFAYCYLPDKQVLLEDSVNEEILAQDEKTVVPDIFHYSTSFDGTTLTLDYTVDSNAKVNGLLCSDRGMVYARKSQTANVGDSMTMTFDCSSLQRDRYIFYINVNGKIYNEKIEKK